MNRKLLMPLAFLFASVLLILPGLSGASANFFGLPKNLPSDPDYTPSVRPSPTATATLSTTQPPTTSATPTPVESGLNLLTGSFLVVGMGIALVSATVLLVTKRKKPHRRYS